jgi:hypothetical protein
VKNLDLQQQLAFCEKYCIDPNQLLLLEILLIAQEGDNPEIVRTYFSSRAAARGRITELLTGLREAGVINKTYKVPEKGSSFNPNDVPINKNLVKDFYKSSFEMGKELFETYPMFGIINGSQVGIRSVSKKFDTLEDCFRYYGKIIRWKPEMHRHIIDLVTWAKENDILVCTLANFIIDQKWLELEALKNGDMGNYNANAIKVV